MDPVRPVQGADVEGVNREWAKDAFWWAAVTMFPNRYSGAFRDVVASRSW